MAPSGFSISRLWGGRNWSEQDREPPRAYYVQRRALRGVAGAAALLALALCFWPLHFLFNYWERIFESLALYQWWPWLYLLGGVLALLGSGILVANTGWPQMPWRWALVLAGIVMAAGGWMALDWSVDWSLGWALFNLIPMGLAALAWAWVLMFWTGAWRWMPGTNLSVIHVLRRRILSRSLGEGWAIPGLAWKRPWGSPHCLWIVENCYTEMRNRLIRDLDQGTDPGPAIQAFDAAAEALIATLQRDWHPDLREKWFQHAKTPAAREMLGIRVAAELITVRLWRDAGRRGELARQARQIHAALHAPAAYRKIMNALFSRAGLPLDPEAAGKLIRGISFQADRISSYSPELLDYCACAWMILTGPLPGAIRFDVWRDLRRKSRESVLLLEALPYGSPTALLNLLARRALGQCYESWAGQIPEFWRQGILDRAEFFKTGMAGEPPAPASLEQWDNATRKLPTWPYRHVWLNGRFHFASALIAVFIIAGWGYLLDGGNPRLPLLDGNTIHHARIRGPGGSVKGINSFAGGKDFVAVGGENGVALVRMKSGVGRRALAGAAVQAIAPGPDENSFLVLSDHSSVVQMEPGRILGGVRTETWVDKPEQPFLPIKEEEWNARGFLATAWSKRGWLCVNRNGGPARYLFSHSKDGTLSRLRSWEMGKTRYENVALAQITADRIWIAEQNGKITALDRASLKPLKNTQTQTRTLERLEAGYDQPWAWARDTCGSIWLYDAANGWAGPFLGCDAGAESAGRVNAARLEGANLWLATDFGFLNYDPSMRFMRTVVGRNAFRQLERLAPGGALAAGPGGLCRGMMDKQGAVRELMLETGAVSEIALSPEKKSILYRMGNGEETQPVHGEVRLIRAPIPEKVNEKGEYAKTLLPGEGWSFASAPAPAVTGMLALENGNWLFAMAQGGAFVYNPARHACEDASKIVDGNKEDRIGGIAQLDAAARVVALAEGKPYIFNRGNKTWNPLGGAGAETASQVAQAGSMIFGRGSTGSLIHFGEGENPARVYGALDDQAASGNHTAAGPLIGDLVTSSGGAYKLVFADGARLFRYDSRLAQMAVLPWPREVIEKDSRLKLLRQCGQDLLALREDGRLMVVNHAMDNALVFGQGALGFDPAQAGAVAREADGSILVGGPEGRVAGYRTDWGAWSERGSERGAGPGKVVELEPTNHGTLARLDTGAVYLLGKGTRVKLPGRAWAMNGPDKLWLALDDGSLGEFGLNDPTSRSTPREAGMKPFIETQAVYSWGGPGGDLHFFASDGRVGTLRTRDGAWIERRLKGINRLEGFSAGTKRAAALDGDTIKLIDEQLEVRDLDQLPYGSNHRQLHVDPDDTVRAAFICDGMARLKVWPQAGPKSGETTWGGNPKPGGFDLSKAVIAFGGNHSALLVDSDEGMATYWIDRGTFDFIKLYGDRQLMGWIRENARAPLMLLWRMGAEGVAQVYDDQANRLKDPMQMPLSWMQWAIRRSGVKVNTPPEEGVLLDGEQFKATRSKGASSYQVRIGDRWRSLTLNRDAFAEDICTDVAFTPSGALWGLQGGVLRRFDPECSRQSWEGVPETARAAWDKLEPTAAGGVLASSEARRLELRESVAGALAPGAANLPLASAALGGRALAVYPGDNGHLRVAWKDDPSGAGFWSARRDGRPAYEVATDLARGPRGELLALTEAGLAVRKIDNLEIVALLPLNGEAKFQRLAGTGRLLIRTASGFVSEWKEGTLQAIPETGRREQVDSWEAPPWRFEMHYDEKGRGSLRALSLADGRPRRWHLDGETGWRFEDDRVLWAALNAGGRVLLATGDGVWDFDILSGRHGNGLAALRGREVLQVCLANAGDLRVKTAAGWGRIDSSGGLEPAKPSASGRDASPERAGAGHPALRIELLDNQLYFHPFDEGADGAPALAGGRFFCDGGEEIAACGTDLFVLAGRRCLVRRPASNPAVPTGCWRLPAMARSAQNVRLKGGDRVEILAANEGEARAWKLENDTWVETPPPGPGPAQRTGIIEWRRVSEFDGTWRPYLAPGCAWDTQAAPAAQPLASWWSKDRFAWDCAYGAGLLSENTGLWVGPLGFVLFVLSKDGGADPVRLYPAEKLEWCAMARDGDRITGLLAGGAQKRYLIQQEGQTVSATKLADPSNTHACAAQVVVARMGESRGKGLRIGFKEHWLPADPAGGPKPPALENEFGWPAEFLLRQGQFAFDRAEAACPAIGGNDSGSKWLSCSQLSGRTGRDCSMMCVNEVVGEGAERRLTLLQADLCGHDFKYLRPGRGGQIYGAGAGPEGRAPDIMAANGENPADNWAPADFETAAAAFRIGDRTSLDLPQLKWEGRARHAWESGEPPFQLINAPEDYPLFAHGPFGTGFSFDVFNALAYHKSARRFMISTAGGMLDLQPGPAALETLGRARLVLPKNPDSGEAPGLVHGPTPDFCAMEFDQDDPEGKTLLARLAREERIIQVREVLPDAWACTVQPQDWIGRYIVRTRWGKIWPVQEGLDADFVLHRQEVSLDFLEKSRRSLAGPIGLQDDPSRGQAWLCTAPNGLFKIYKQGLH